MPEREDGLFMPSTPFDATHQDNLRAMIGKVLPSAGAQPVATAVAAGYGYRSHEAFLAAIREVEAGRPAPAPDFDADRLVSRLQELDERVGEQDEALRFLLSVMADGPRSGPPTEPQKPDEVLARHRLRTGRLFIQLGLWQDAGNVLGDAMGAAPAGLKGEVAAALELAAPHSDVAAANLALALLSADGVPRDVGRASSLLKPLVRSQEAELRGYAHNWLGHIASGELGGSRNPALALSHFEQAAAAGHGEAAFNAGLMHDEGQGVPASEDKARDLYRRGAALGHVPSMTNFACKILVQDPGEATDFFEQAAAAGDDKAAGILQAIMETGMARAIGDGPALDEEDDVPPPVCVVPSGMWRPKAIAAALREQSQGPSKEAEDITAFMFGFGSWRELVRAATKGKADPPDESCSLVEVDRRRTYQAYVLESCSNMGPVAAGIAVEALQPTAKAGRPVLAPGTLARMRAASREHAETQRDEEFDDDEDDLDDIEDLAGAVGHFMEAAGLDPEADPMDLLDDFRRMQPIQPDVWLGVMEEHLGWSFADVDDDAERDGDQVAVAIGSEGRRVPVVMSSVAYIPGDFKDEHVARLKAGIGTAHPAGAVLMFNKPTGWLAEPGADGLVYGGLLWWAGTWSDFVLRPGGGLDDALAQRGRDLVQPDAHTVATLGFAEASGVLHSLAAYLTGLEPEEADVQFLRSAHGWLMPLAAPL